MNRDLSCRIRQIERVTLRLKHPRAIGCNGRIGVHGDGISDPVVRVTVALLDGWEQRDGYLIVPDTPGTGFDLEPDTIDKGVAAEGGFRVTS